MLSKEEKIKYGNLLYSDANRRVASLMQVTLRDGTLYLQSPEGSAASSSGSFESSNHSLIGAKVLRNKQNLVIDYGSLRNSIYLRASDEIEAYEWQQELITQQTEIATKGYTSNASAGSDSSGRTTTENSNGSKISSAENRLSQVNVMSQYSMSGSFLPTSSSMPGAIPTQRGASPHPGELLTAVMAFLLEEGYSYTGDLNTSINATIPISGGRDLIFTIHYLPPEKSHSSRSKHILGVLVATSIVFIRAPVPIRDELMYLLTRANYGLRIGCFIMDPTRDGMIKYRSELPLENFRLEEMVHLVRKLLSHNLQTHRRYVSAFAALLEDGKPAADAIKLVEGDVTVRKSRSEEDQQEIISLVERILKERDFPYETLPQAIVAYYAIDVETTLVINIRIEENMALVISHAINSSPSFARQQLGEVAIRASARCRIGQFNFDYRDGQVLFQTELPLFGIPDEDLEEFLVPLIMENVMTQRLYLPSFQAVIQRGLTPADAIALIDNTVNASAGKRQPLGSATAAAVATSNRVVGSTMAEGGGPPTAVNVTSSSPQASSAAVKQSMPMQGVPGQVLAPAPSAPISQTTQASGAGLSPVSQSKVTELDITKLRNCSKKIGSGGMGEVYLCEYDKIPVAVKQVYNREDLPREIEIQASVDHPCLVRLRGQIHGYIESRNGSLIINANPERLMMISEYCAGGNLRQWLETIRSDPKKFFEHDVILFMEDIAKGMAELHRLGIIHRDLKPENIFLDDDCRRAKIGDFGLARQLRRRPSFISEDQGDKAGARGGNSTMFTIFDNCGTHIYIAPECLDHGEVSRASDVYAFAIILHNVFLTQDSDKTYDQHEILGDRLPSMFNQIFSDRVKEGMRPAINIHGTLPFSKETLNTILPLMQRCWDGEQIKRPKFDDIVNILKILRERIRERRSSASSSSLLSSTRANALPVLAVSGFNGEVRKLGQGAMGVAYASVYHGTHVALKEVLKDKDNERFLTEINTQAFVKHPNIVQVMGTVAARVRSNGSKKDSFTLVPDNERQMMVSEYCTEGSLGSYLKAVREQRRSFDETRLVAFMRDIAKGMAWLHGLKIVHKDLKPENIFLHDSLRQAKIGDFGLAKTLRKRDVSESGATGGPRGSTYTIFGNAGTLYYIAPECFLTGRTTRSADVYAFGIILHNCFITQDEAKTYDARRVLGRGVPSEYSRLFIDQLLNDHLRPAFPQSTKMSSEVAGVIIPMIRECLADEDTKVVSPDENQHHSSRRPKFQDLLPRLDALFDRLKVTKPSTTSDDLPVITPVSKPVVIVPPAPPVDIGPSSPTKGLEDALELLKFSQPEMKAPAPSVSAAAAYSPANKGPQAVAAEPVPLTIAVSPPVSEKKLESAAVADSSNQTTSSASFRFQPLTALSKIKEELGMDPSVSVKEAIEMAAEDIGLTEELTSISRVKEKVEKICEVMGLDETSFFNPLQTISEKDFKIDLVVKSSMKYELGIKDGLSVIQTLIAYADALGINDEEFMKLSIKAKAERVAEELGIFSGRTGAMSTTIKTSSAL